jgi:hypothetical protein
MATLTTGLEEIDMPTITDQSVIHFVEETLAEPGYDSEAIMNELRPYVQFGYVSAEDYVPEDEWEEHRSKVDRTSDLIARMLRANGISEDDYWEIVWCNEAPPQNQRVRSACTITGFERT